MVFRYYCFVGNADLQCINSPLLAVQNKLTRCKMFFEILVSLIFHIDECILPEKVSGTGVSTPPRMKSPSYLSQF